MNLVPKGGFCLTVHTARGLMSVRLGAAMTKLTAFMISVALAIGVWLLAPMLEPALLEPWLVGVGRWSWITLHGREIAAGVIALATWIAALHFPPRPRHIWIRHSAPA